MDDYNSMLQGPEITYSNRKVPPMLKSMRVFTYSLLEIAVKISQVLGANAEQIANTIYKNYMSFNVLHKIIVLK